MRSEPTFWVLIEPTGRVLTREDGALSDLWQEGDLLVVVGAGQVELVVGPGFYWHAGQAFARAGEKPFFFIRHKLVLAEEGVAEQAEAHFGVTGRCTRIVPL